MIKFLEKPAIMLKNGRFFMQEMDYKQIKLNFQENYFKNIKPKLHIFEKVRLKNKKDVIKYSILTVLICFATAVALFVWGDLKLAVFFAVAAIVLPFMIIKHFEKKLEVNVKKALMPLICGCFDNLAWHEEYRGDLDEFKRIKLVESYNRESSDDYFKGLYNDIPFEIIEALFQTKIEVDGWERTITNFEGVIVKIKAVKEFSSHTVIRTDGTNLLFSNLKRTELEDVVFEGKYDVFTNDEIEARYLITTAFMERFNNIKKVFKARYVTAAFYGEYFYLALDTRKDMFKIKNLNKEIKDASLFVDMFEEILGIYKLIDYLKLTHK